MMIMPAAVITQTTTVGHEGHELDGKIQNTDPALDASSEPSSSLPNSQSSSLNDSTASQASQNHSSSIDTSQSSVDELLRRHASPLSLSTSHETQAYHDGIRDGGIPRSQTISREHEIPPPPRLTTSQPVSRTNPNDHITGTSHGQKRTSSGYVKAPSLSSSTSPVDSVPKGHSRHTSTASNGSQVGELSAQLRTRLSYALVKVQNGWQSRTIDEVESLASQQTSPVAIAPPSRQSYVSPQSDMMDLYRERSGFVQSSERSTAPPSQTLQAPTHTIDHDAAYTKGAYPNFSTQLQQNRNSSQHRPEHLGRHAGSQQYNFPTQGPSLAPPFDGEPRVSRRPNTSYAQPPPLKTQGLSNLSASSRSSIKSNMPATPPQRRPAAIRTPSEKVSAMETDAIETLLFMSSPGNTQHRPTSSHPPGTPLRSHFEAAVKRVGFAGDCYTSVGRPKQNHLLGSIDLGDDANIDKLLDQMPEEESSGDDEMLSPRLADLR